MLVEIVLSLNQGVGSFQTLFIAVVEACIRLNNLKSSIPQEQPALLKVQTYYWTAIFVYANFAWLKDLQSKLKTKISLNRV